MGMKQHNETLNKSKICLGHKYFLNIHWNLKIDYANLILETMWMSNDSEEPDSQIPFSNVFALLGVNFSKIHLFIFFKEIY